MIDKPFRFDRETRALEVVSGVDLWGKRAIVTGASSGIGIETARALVSCGCEVTLAVRNGAAGERAAKCVVGEQSRGRAVVAPLDLSDFRSIEGFAKRERTRPLDILICNAAVMACPFERTRDGFEMQLGVNHVGHAFLVEQLLPALELVRSARVVMVSSSAHWWSPLISKTPAVFIRSTINLRPTDNRRPRTFFMPWPSADTIITIA